jgi:hypothetical protein
MTTIAFLLIASQSHAGEQVISVQHDSARQVTCWITASGGISCLPDNQLGSLPQTATASSDLGRISKASLIQENVPLPTTQLPQNERLKL